MSKPTNIYKSIPRDLLENLAWQLQQTGIEYERCLGFGVEAESQQSLLYVFECPTASDAETVRDCIHEQAEDKISIERSGNATLLKGETAEFEFALPTILRWVGYMCDAGAKVGCRFEEWRCAGVPQEASAGSQVVVGSFGQDRKRDYAAEIVIELPGNIGPMERGQRFRGPIDEALARAGLGETTGGESVLATEHHPPTITGARLFVGTDCPEEAIHLLRELLPTLDCPQGTKLIEGDRVIAVR